jgi:hypothetical protein
MDPVLRGLRESALRSIAEAIARDAQCRMTLRDVATKFISWVDALQPHGAEAPAAAEQTAAVQAFSNPPPPASPPPAEIAKPEAREVQRMTLRLGDEEVTVAASALRERTLPPPVTVGANPSVVAEPPRVAHDGPAADPETIAARCRVKAEACRLSGERRRRRLAGGDPRELNDDVGRIIARAKALPSCYLWSIDPRGPHLPDEPALEALAGSYDALADAIELLARCQGERELASWVEPAVRLAAEAQSALRAGMMEIDLVGGERDQQEAFRWITGITRDYGFYVDRHMRADDPADPAGWSDLRGRVKALAESIEQRRRSKRERAQLYGKIRYLVGRLTGERPDHEAGEWRSLQAAVESLLALKVPPSDAALRENLLPLVESELELPPEYMGEGSGMRQVLDQVGRYVESSSADRNAEADAPDGDAGESAGDVAEVARLLRGRRVVLIGGEPRPAAKAALERAFGLSELDWLSAPAHSSFWNFEPAIARADTAVVLLMIRWSSHSFGEVRSICERFGKPLVRLPAGYNASQVAHQVLQQCGVQLAAAAAGNGSAAGD